MLWSCLKRASRAEWLGPADLPQSLTMEWRLITVRWVGILVVGPALPFLDLPLNHLAGAFAILVFATV
jgi:hypothetical protein